MRTGGKKGFQRWLPGEMVTQQSLQLNCPPALQMQARDKNKDLDLKVSEPFSNCIDSDSAMLFKNSLPVLQRLAASSPVLIS